MLRGSGVYICTVIMRSWNIGKRGKGVVRLCDGCGVGEGPTLCDRFVLYTAIVRGKQER